MKRLRCHLPNASELINGIAFAPVDGGSMLSEPVGDDVAALFADIPGYTIEDGDGEEQPAVEEHKEEPKPAKKKPHQHDGQDGG